MRSIRLLALVLGASCLLFSGLVQSAPQPAQAAKAKTATEPVIVVGGQSMALAEFEAAVRQTMRQKFYHGKVPDSELQALLKDVADQIVNDALLAEEAKRRGMKPSKDKIDQTIAGYDQQYGANPNWKQNREAMLARVVPELERRDLLDQIDQAVRNVPGGSDKEVKAFYESKKELFTEPEKLRLSLIMLVVDPAAGRPAWDKAMEEGKAIHKRLKAGADFAEAARLHSGDESAKRGGDMGYVHRGMLPEALQAKVDSFKIGEIQEPIMALQGVAILRVDDRTAPKLRSFEDVKARAGDLLKRERGETARKELIAQLRSRTKFVIRNEQFAELVGRLQ